MDEKEAKELPEGDYKIDIKAFIFSIKRILKSGWLIISLRKK